MLNDNIYFKMTKNRLLNIAITLCKFIRLIYIVLFLVLTIGFIHFQINPDAYKDAKYGYNSSGISFNKSTKWKVSGAGDDKDVYTLNNIKITSLYFLYFKLSTVLVLVFLSVKEFQKVVQSVKNIQTFQINNAISFNRIGKYILAIFLLTSYNSIRFQQGGFSGFQVSITPLILMILAFIMSEIFKEGNSLKAENDLTI